MLFHPENQSGNRLISRIDSLTGLLCVLGRPVTHSFSPQLMNGLFTRYDLNQIYLAFSPLDLALAIEGLRELEFIGANITIPFKEEIIPLCDAVDPSIDEIKAVNTLFFDDGTLRGYNTDVEGIRIAIGEQIKNIDSYAVFWMK